MNRKLSFSTALMFFYLCSLPAQISFSNLIFSQHFSGPTTVSSYVGTGAGQFDGITTSGAGLNWSIVGGQLQAVRTGNAGSITISSKNFQSSGLGSTFNYRWRMTFSNITASSTNDMTFSVGDNLTSANTHPANADTHSDFRINLTNGSPDTVTIRNDNDTGASDVATYNVTSPLTLDFSWYVNNTGSSFSYFNPNGGISTLNNDANSIWISTDGGITWTAVTNNFGPGPNDTPSNALNDFKFVWQGTGSNATISFDYFEFYNVPEPSVVVGISLAVLLVGVAIYRRRRAVRENA